jgi:hypothetical protein
MKHSLYEQSLLHGECSHTPSAIQVGEPEISVAAAFDWVIDRCSGTAPDRECGSSPQFELDVRVQAVRFTRRFPSHSMVIGAADCGQGAFPEFSPRMIFGACCVLRAAIRAAAARLVVTH